MEGYAGSPPVRGAVQALQVGGWCVLWEGLPGRVFSLRIQRSGRPLGLKGPWLPRSLPSRPVLLSVGPLTWSSGTGCQPSNPALPQAPQGCPGPTGLSGKMHGSPFQAGLGGWWGHPRLPCMLAGGWATLNPAWWAPQARTPGPGPWSVSADGAQEGVRMRHCQGQLCSQWPSSWSRLGSLGRWEAPATWAQRLGDPEPEVAGHLSVETPPRHDDSQQRIRAQLGRPAVPCSHPSPPAAPERPSDPGLGARGHPEACCMPLPSPLGFEGPVRLL